MKAQELRIGNYVFDDENQICKISVLMSKQKTNFEGYDVNDFHRVEYDSDKVNIYISKVINPIPLTEEWFGKFGFENNELRANHNTLKWYGNHIGVNGMLGTVKPVECIYIHQLQNLYFALTGQELKIKENQK